MLLRSMLGIAALLAGTSCVPLSATSSRTAAPPLSRHDARLLDALALTPPPAGPADKPDTTAPGIAFAAPLTAPLTARASAPPFAAAEAGSDDARRALQCLTAAVYYEARSDPADGQRAVAQVVLKRVRDRAFPGSVCGVVYQRAAASNVCQFSFACDGSMRRPLDPAAWERARSVAAAALGGSVYAPAGAATHFHTAAISPWWAPSLAQVGRIGAHVFYGWRRAMAGALSFRRAYAGIEPGAPGPAAWTPAAWTIAQAAQPDAAATEHGVTVHRGQLASADSTAKMIKVATLTGVRIHRGKPGPVLAAAADMMDGAEIGPES